MKYIFLIITLSTLMACKPQYNPQDYKDVLALETYKIPTGFEQEVQYALSGLLNLKEAQGKVRSLPGGYLLVSASPNFHAGVRKLIKELKSKKPIKDSNIRLSIWFLAGKKSQGLSVPNELTDLKDSLDVLYNKQGFGEFRLIESMENIGRNGQHVETEGRFLESKNTSRITSSRSNLAIDLRSPFGKIKSIFLVEANQTLVLGKMGFSQRGGSRMRELKEVLGNFVINKNDEAKTSFFYLVKTEIVN